MQSREFSRRPVSFFIRFIRYMLLTGFIVSFNSLVTKEQYRSVSQALTNARGKIIDIARSGVPHAYKLYRPRGYTERTPTQHRVHIATTLTRTGSLTIMHSHHFDMVSAFVFGAMKCLIFN